MAASIPTILLNIGSSFLLSAAAQALSPKKDKSPRSRGRIETIRSSVAPRRIILGKARVGGVFTYGRGRGAGGAFLTTLLTLSGTPVSEFVGYYVEDKPVTLDGNGTVQTWPWTNLITIKTAFGDQAVDGNLLAALQQWSGGEWNPTTHRQDGCAKLLVDYLWSPGVYPRGAPPVSVVVKGSKVYDPRDGGQSYDDPSTWTWSDNATLCQAYYLAGYDLDYYGERVPVAFGAGEGEIDWDQVVAAANIDDEAVSLSGGGSETRYSCNGIIEGGSHEDNLQAIGSANWSKLLYTGGKFFPVPASYRTPAVTLTDEDLLGEILVQPRNSRRDTFNTAQATYYSEAQNWQETDAPAYQSAAGLAEDGEIKLPQRPMKLPFTSSASMAQRIEKIAVLSNRQQLSSEIVVTLQAGLRLRGADTVQATLSQAGWSSKVFEIERWRLAWVQVRSGPPALGVKLHLRETADSVYDWSSTEEVGVDPAPDTTFKSPSLVDPPTDLVLGEEQYTSRDGGGVKVRLTLSWTASPDVYLEDYLVEYRLSTASEWVDAGITTDTEFEIPDFSPAEYDVRVSARNGIRAISEPLAVYAFQVSGLADIPASLTGLSIQAIGGSAMLYFDLHPALDVREGGRIEFRHSPDTSSPSWENSVSIGEWVPGDSTQAQLPLRPGAYMAKPVDALGNYAASEATVITDGELAQGYANLSTVAEAPDFAGTHSGTAAPDGQLKLSGATAVDDIADVDDVSDWDSEGGMVASGTYTFAAGFDFGARTRVRLRPVIAAVAVNLLDLIDDRSDPIDSWQDFDGTAGVDVDAWVEARTTPDDPSGAPVWSSYSRIDSAEVYDRGVSFQAQLRSSDPAYNIQISTLSVDAEEVA